MQKLPELWRTVKTTVTSGARTVLNSRVGRIVLSQNFAVAATILLPILIDDLSYRLRVVRLEQQLSDSEIVFRKAMLANAKQDRVIKIQSQFLAIDAAILRGKTDKYTIECTSAGKPTTTTYPLGSLLNNNEAVKAADLGSEIANGTCRLSPPPASPQPQ